MSRRVVAVAALSVALAATLGACTPDGGGNPDPPSSPATTTVQPPAAPDPVVLADGDLADGPDCLTTLPEPRWLVGEGADGQQVGAALVGSGDTLVVLGHQSDGRSCAWTDLALALTDAGFLVGLPSFGGADPIALQLGLVDLARAEGVTGIVVGGASMGGTYAVGAAAVMDPAPDAVVVLSPADDFDPPGPPATVDAVAAAPFVTAPILVAVGDNDTAFVDAAEQIADAAPDSDLVVIESGAHGVSLLSADPALESRILELVAGV